MSEDLKFRGGPELISVLRQAPEKLQKNVLRGGMRAGAVVVQKDARTRIHNVSGELAKGLKVSSKFDGAKVIASVKVKGPHAFIGHMLEFTGAKPHDINGALLISGKFASHVEHPGFKPSPFLRPALDERGGDAVVAVGNYMKRRLETKGGLDTADVIVEEVA